MKRYFVTGTDTDCGKTYVTGQLALYLKQQHYRVHAIKPVASGCVEKAGRWVSEDAAYLAKMNIYPSDEGQFWRFQQPIAPHLAAAAHGVTLTSKAIANACETAALMNLDYLLIEGAGGLMVPLNSTETWCDFLVQTNIPVMLVVGMRLGCINHALLTAAVLKSRGIPCAGWIANCLLPEMAALEGNLQTLTDYLLAPPLAVVPYGGGIESIRF